LCGRRVETKETLIEALQNIAWYGERDAIRVETLEPLWRGQGIWEIFEGKAGIKG